MGLFSSITNIAAPLFNPLSTVGGLGGLTGEKGYKEGAGLIGDVRGELSNLYGMHTGLAPQHLAALSMRDFTSSPGFEFSLSQGLKGAERALAARGMRGSGNELIELQNLAQGMAMQDYEKEFQRRLATAGLSTGAMGQYGGMLSNLATGQAGMLGQAGAAKSGFLQDIIGTGAGMFAMSDRDLKENLVHQYDLVPNVGIYEFNYKGSPEKHIGVIAQEVEQVLPQAVTMKNGYRAVNYGLLYSVLD